MAQNRYQNLKKPLLYSILLTVLLLSFGCSKNQSGGLQEIDSPFSASTIENSSPDPDLSEGQELDESVTKSRRNAITNAVDNASSSVVSVMSSKVVARRNDPRDEFFRYFFGEQQPQENNNMGSGFIISDDGLVVTNQHVVGSDPDEVMISTIYGETYEAELIGSDELTDLALLRIKSEEAFPFIQFSDSDEILVGEWAIALGNPFGLFEDGQPTVTVGVVSAKNRDFRPDPNNPRVYIDMIQTDAAINRGNSGGPLLNSKGEVIGINTFIYTGGTGSGFIGLSFAIPSNRIDKIISQLLSSGSVVLDYNPGMEFTSMTESLVYSYRLPYVQGLLVTSINKDGPAYSSGIMPGDIILKIGDERVVSEMHAWALLREYDEGDRMMIELLRENNHYETEMHLRKSVRMK